jgi:L-ribulose-5-phosphate 3-epimerase
MGITRRQLLSGVAAASLAAAQDPQPGGQFRRQNGPKPRSAPPICLFSDQLDPSIGYDELGGIIKMLGFDGCDLSVQPGGHIAPEHADLDFMRAVESMTGSGVDVYMISTTFTSPMDQTLRLAMQWGGEMGVPCFRPGHWKYTSAETDARLVEVQRDIAGLAAVARATGISVGLHNATPDCVGGALWDTNLLIRGIDARFVGYDFDTGYAVAQGGPEAFRTLVPMVLPRLKMVAARDCYWNKEGSDWKLVQCPLGEGMVDWTKLFAALSKARFTGPISVQIGYPAKDQLAAIRKDLAFLKKQVAAVYQ